MTNTLYTQALALHHALLVAHWATRPARRAGGAALQPRQAGEGSDGEEEEGM